ncbi:DUF2530 domain-containing protein [Streptomyces sp. RKND-216]|uniref:DUF2530 domain-containing protein n=1 Tax=Streptomyces sp. RKND-216 TaxID=2562581 RepID=UPI00109DB7C6|nr:DUF2530 domain-containing protein [Streptomyces sp. RKND-216]THA25845.1 DUF2530 domain-containing protein [Streptomyces sp. RKND-216]
MGLISKWTDGEREAPEPLEGPVVGAVVTGTLVWFLLFVGQLPFYGWFSDHGHTWWIWACAAGAGLGLVGLLYVRRRFAALRRTAGPSTGDASQPAPDPAGGSGRRAPAE